MDIRDSHGDAFDNCKNQIERIENDYEGELTCFVDAFKSILEELSMIFNDSFERDSVNKKLALLTECKKSTQIAIIHDITNQVMEFISDNGEKSFNESAQ